ncbi:MAG TPA: hypothetical protein ENK65_03155 [Helicobacteraceae bacterium]|nr:hypothetical protein [Helicobacteraceae bacterium]
MKFTLVKDLRGNALLRPLLGGLLSFIILFLSADIILKNDHIGLTSATLSATLYGDEENYVEPVSFHFILELLHSDIFFMMMVLLTLSAIYSRLCEKNTIRMVLINLTMIAAIADVALLLFAYFQGPLFMLPWIISFWVWHLGAMSMAFASLLHLFILKKAH